MAHIFCTDSPAEQQQRAHAFLQALDAAIDAVCKKHNAGIVATSEGAEFEMQGLTRFTFTVKGHVKPPKKSGQ
jgi:hypothetical protein